MNNEKEVFICWMIEKATHDWNYGSTLFSSWYMLNLNILSTAWYCDVTEIQIRRFSCTSGLSWAPKCKSSKKQPNKNKTGIEDWIKLLHLERQTVCFRLCCCVQYWLFCRNRIFKWYCWQQQMCCRAYVPITISEEETANSTLETMMLETMQVCRLHPVFWASDW